MNKISINTWADVRYYSNRLEGNIYYNFLLDALKNVQIFRYENPNFENAHKIMEDSYAKKKRKLHYYDVTSARIETFLDTIEKFPLQAEVYKIIQRELENIFKDFN